MGLTDTADHLRRARLVGEKIYLRALEKEDVNDEYLNWLNDISINKNIRGAVRPVSMLDLEQQFENAQKRSNEVNFAVCDLESGIHIGNLECARSSCITAAPTSVDCLAIPVSRAAAEAQRRCSWGSSLDFTTLASIAWKQAL